MKLLKKGIILAVFASLLVLSACGGGNNTTGNSPSENTGSQGAETPTSGKEYTFKLTHITQTTHAWHMFAEKFGEELAARSNGRMKLEIFPAAQLGPESDMVQQLETGSLEFGLLTLPYLSTRTESLNGWLMPFLFPNLEASIKAKDSEPARKMLEELDEHGVIGLDYMFAGNHHLLMKNTAVNSLEDIKGKKVRYTGGQVAQEFWAGFGASPIAMGLNEVYTSLQTGVIDGVSVDTSGLLTEKFEEIADNFTLTNHMAFPGIVVISKVVYEQMPAEDQQIVNEAVAAAIEWGNNELLRIDAENVELLKEKLTVIEIDDMSSFQKVKDEIYEKYSANPLIKEFIEVNSQ